MSNPMGFAIRRNGTCHSSIGEVDCGPTWDNFHACCPGGAYCSSTRDPTYYNAECCDAPGVNCTQTILDQGSYCANQSWNMFDNGGFFCCEAPTQGFTNGPFDGCADPSSTALSSGETFVPLHGQVAKRKSHTRALARQERKLIQIGAFSSFCDFVPKASLWQH